MNKEKEKELLRKKLGRTLTVSESGEIELKHLNLNQERSGKGGVLQEKRIDKILLNN